MLNQPSSEIGVPDGFTQKEWELKRKYPDFSPFITTRVAEERERNSNGLVPDLDGIENEIRQLRKRRKYKSGKARGKS